MNNDQVEFAKWIVEQFPELDQVVAGAIALQVSKLARKFHREYTSVFQNGILSTDYTDVLENEYAKKLTDVFRQHTQRKVGWLLGGDYRGNIVRMIVPTDDDNIYSNGGVAVPY